MKQFETADANNALYLDVDISIYCEDFFRFSCASRLKQTFQSLIESIELFVTVDLFGQFQTTYGHETFVKIRQNMTNWN